ncbi:MAG: fasciclin protein [Sphingobacterium sp.]|jgi:uncharacterized surface protein with fasciclin (FAS1) repeats|nr:fasciclin protein [Sphingobacterium sp.]
MKQKLTVLMMAVMACTVSCIIFSCSKDNPEVDPIETNKPKPTNSLVTGLETASGFSILSKIASKVELAEMLHSAGPVTLFAPADSCWETYLKMNRKSSIDDFSKEQLTAILQYHIVKGKLSKDELYKKYSIPDPDGSTSYISSIHSTLAKGEHGAPLSLFVYQMENKIFINSNYEAAEIASINPVELLNQADKQGLEPAFDAGICSGGQDKQFGSD